MNRFVTPATARARTVVMGKTFLLCIAYKLNIDIVGKFFADTMHEASKDISREEVNNIVRPEEHKRNPDITNNAGGIYCPFTPLHGDVLIGKDR